MRKGLSATDFGLSFISTNPTQMLPGSLLRRWKRIISERKRNQEPQNKIEEAFLVRIKYIIYCHESHLYGQYAIETLNSFIIFFNSA